MRRLVALIAAAVALSVTVPAHAAAPDPVAAPPTAETYTTITNALMRPDEVPAVLGRPTPASTEYMIPPGGQDEPYPVCPRSGAGPDIVPAGTGATQVTSTAGLLTQQVVFYPSTAAAGRAWSDINAAMPTSCAGTVTNDGDTTVTTAGRLAVPGNDGWWVRTEITKGKGDAVYVVSLPVGGTIQVLYFTSDRPSTTAQQRAAIDALAVTLARRLARLASLPLTQPELMTAFQRNGMQPADIPASLPVTQPRDGGWSSQSAMTPGTGPWVCNAGGTRLPRHVGTFTVAYGGTGGVLAVPGSINQVVDVYPDHEVATLVWDRITAKVLACNQANPEPVTSTTSVSRIAAGTSSLVVDGTPGVWFRTLDTFVSDESSCGTTCTGAATKSYTIYLLAGRSIQSVTYTRSIDTAAQVPLDQVPVNTLAQDLALRWMQTIG